MVKLQRLSGNLTEKYFKAELRKNRKRLGPFETILIYFYLDQI